MRNSVNRLCEQLQCPNCYGKLKIQANQLVCNSDTHETAYPIVGDVAVVLDDNKSIFSIEDYMQHKDTTWKSNRGSLRKLVRALTPEITHNIKAKENYQFIASLLSSNSNVLIIGGGVKGPGIEIIYDLDGISIIASDVFIGPHVDMVFDAHDIPFESGTFDFVVVQSVLEHVLDPVRCVAEIHRVLKADGLVYAETPFIQQVHMKEYDFTRFTDLGHRRLFREFSELKRGSTGGPGMALAWSYRAFVRSFTDNTALRSILTIFSHWTSFYLKYFDYWLIDRSAASEASSEYYFLGRKSDKTLSDSDLISQYKGVRW